MIAIKNRLFYLNYEECKGNGKTIISNAITGFILTMRNVKKSEQEMTIEQIKVLS